MSIHDEIKKAGSGVASVGNAIALLKQVAVEFAEYLGSKPNEWGLVPCDRNRLAIGQSIEEHDFLVTDRGRSIKCQMWLSADDVPNSGNTLQFPIKATITAKNVISIALDDIMLPMQGDKSTRISSYSTMADQIKQALAQA